jgi:hypothetical protein
MGQWRKLHSGELHNLYSSLDQIKKNKVGEACGTYGIREKHVYDFGGKAQGKETT